MRLKTIKLAGFKSFVEPTTLSLRGHLTAIVGPNGCGKSNVVDAIRWVIGESSARQLRGELLTDVIFNGSTQRKPVGQASVELLFDNAEGSLGGVYAQYTEIAIRREITREGHSQFYLNGTRCRRRDVTDLFLGTGLGPSSYAIIEQGVISQLVESKPEELRVYLEEAAGISKYRERRRETESRMNNTRDNLDRLQDVRQEIDKQLEHLKRQAHAAERFKILKQEQRELRAQLHGLHYQTLEQRVWQGHQQIEAHLAHQEEKCSEQRVIEEKLKEFRALQVGLQEELQQIQEHYYELGSEIVRQEQHIQRIQERQKQQQDELKQVQQNLEEAEHHLLEDQTKHTLLMSEWEAIIPQKEQWAQAALESSLQLEQIEEQVQQFQNEWEDFQVTLAQIEQKTSVEKTQLHHLEEKIKDIERQSEQLRQQKESLTPHDLSQELSQLEETLMEKQQQVEESEIRLIKLRQQNQTLRFSQEQQRLKIEEKKQKINESLRQQASLEALQKAALGQNEQSVERWLQQQGWDKKTRLLEHIQVVSGWETAVETVLTPYLKAICTDNIQDFLIAAQAVSVGSLTLFHQPDSMELSSGESFTGALPLASRLSQAETLASKVTSPWAVELLANVYVTENAETAMNCLPLLNPGESVVTRSGIWLGASWLRIHKHQDKSEGILQRKQWLEEIQQIIQSLQAECQVQEECLKEGIETLSLAEQERERLQQSFTQLTSQCAAIQAELKAKKIRLEQSLHQEARILQQLAEQDAQSHQAQAKRDHFLNLVENDQALLNHHQQRRSILVAQRDTQHHKLTQCRQQAQADRQRMDEHDIRVSTLQNQCGLLEQSIGRAEKQVKQAAERQALLLQQADITTEPLIGLEENLQTQRERRQATEKNLQLLRNKVTETEQQQRSLEHQFHEINQELQGISAALEQLRIDQGTIQAHQQHHQEQIIQAGFTLEALLGTLPKEAGIEICQQQLERMDAKIQRLGAINLAAIEEFQALQERKDYLDHQNQDLQEALNRLEESIRKIDRETRARLRDTFERANAYFKALFVQVFGGGQAELELTSDELLSAGMIIRAQPPGKRNALLHLLSGGEKALTAVALVFALFQLNPAPFCVLDEVDAPLDEANVRRFSNLVASMSHTVQFIFISHNKVTMEMSQQLIGVTMQEPGVSRLVSVDVAEALAMATA